MGDENKEILTEEEKDFMKKVFRNYIDEKKFVDIPEKDQKTYKSVREKLGF